MTEFAGMMSGRSPESVPTRVLVFDGVLTSEQAEKTKLIYRYLWDLPAPVRRAILTDLALQQSDGTADRG